MNKLIIQVQQGNLCSFRP